jgi:hypothetical protein
VTAFDATALQLKQAAKNIERAIDQAEYMDDFRIVPIDEPGRSIKWRRGIATALHALHNCPRLTARAPS